MKNSKLTKIIIIGATAIIAILGVSLYFIIDDSLKTAQVNLMIAPLSVDITLNNQKYDNAKNHRIKPGEYQINITKDGYFEPYSTTFTIKAGETKDFSLILTPLDNTNWYQQHPEDTLPMDAIIGQELTSEGRAIAANYPLLTYLPTTVEYYENGKTYVYYTISYSLNTTDKVPKVIIQDYTGGNYDKALERIRITGYNPNNYNIEYQDKTADLIPSRAPND